MPKPHRTQKELENELQKLAAQIPIQPETKLALHDYDKLSPKQKLELRQRAAKDLAKAKTATRVEQQ